MNGLPNPGNVKKGSLRKELTPIGMESIALKNPMLLPPPLPNISMIPTGPPKLPTPVKINSPRDNTNILVNGSVVDVSQRVNDRIDLRPDMIKPLTPPPLIQEYRHSPMVTNLSPNNYVDSQIRIVETPDREITPVTSYTEREHTPTTFFTRDDTEINEQSVRDSPDTPDTPITSVSTVKTKSTARTSKSLMSILPKFNKSKSNNKKRLRLGLF
jgi:hypothetical protein